VRQQPFGFFLDRGAQCPLCGFAFACRRIAKEAKRFDALRIGGDERDRERLVRELQQVG